jgi:prepilin-type N-terminal cleavage/methylation domain-containing protein
MKKNQPGFTLIEITIVLVIIGLLLGGVLKGQELIAQAKIKNVINDLNGAVSAIYAYQDRYKALPGDDKGAAARWTGTTSGAGDGTVCGTYNGTAAVASGSGIACATGATTADSLLLWQHLRLAGFLSGAGTDVPQNAVGGLTGIQAGAFGLTGHVICTSNLPARIAVAVDSQLDDGILNSGSVRGTAQTDLNPAADGSAGTASAYVDDGSKLYIVCRSF